MCIYWRWKKKLEKTKARKENSHYIAAHKVVTNAYLSVDYYLWGYKKGISATFMDLCK